MNPRIKPIALTPGDPAGIGPEIVVKAFLEAPEFTQGCFIAGDVSVIRDAARIVVAGRMPPATVLIERVSEAASAPPGCLPVLQATNSLGLFPKGHVSADAGRFAGNCVLAASRLALSGEIAAIVTAPLNKESLSLAGSPFSSYPGHTELLQSKAAEWGKISVDQLPVRMMLVNDELRVVLVSIHVALRNAIAAVTFDNVLQTIQIANRALAPWLGFAPRIAVAGLNPHAGEAGLLGTEEAEIIKPAIDAAKRIGINVTGPMSPDTVFMRARRSGLSQGEFDVVVAMYHDQGLIPIKYLGIDDGVNVTLGLPYVRTSPDHGTAFDLAGTGRASPSSFIAALRTARAMVASQ
jgi:4-hydroxythreonine-4-phosphate dehydrogenase